MRVETTLITVALTIEEDTKESSAVGWPLTTEEEVRKAVLAAVAVLLRDRPYAKINWESMTEVPLDGAPACGRCAVCNRWVYDAENRTELTPTAIGRGAVIDGRLLCDEHLPKDHPVAF